MRVQKLQQKLTELGLDALILPQGANCRYISGFTGSNATLVIPAQHKPSLVTDFRYIEQAGLQCPEFSIIDQAQTGNLKTVVAQLQLVGAKKVGFAPEHTTYQTYTNMVKEGQDISWVPTPDLIEKMRQVKNEEELKTIEKAEAIGDLAFAAIVPFIRDNWKNGLTERDVALQIEIVMRQNGASGTSFETIVASGEKSSLPHARPTNDVLKEGDLVVMDFGCIYNGYCSDMTRTIGIGTLNDKQKEIYNIVLKAQLTALNNMKIGMTGKEIDALARDVITDAGYSKYFGHGLGHSLGLEIHEEPRASVLGNTVFEKNMVVTVEPGIYIPHLGGVRIEDLVVITDNGIKNLTHSPKELIIV